MTPVAGRIDPESLNLGLVETIVRRGIPFCGELNVRVVAVGKGIATLGLPYDERLIGDPETGVLAGGVVTSLIDTACGMAVFSALGEVLGIATLDLRIDYLKPAAARKEVLATAECYKLTRTVAFIRGHAFHADSPDDWIATCASTFMVGSSEQPPLPPDWQKPGA